MTAIKKSLPSFIAIVALVVLAGGISYYILQEQRLRIPVLEEKPFQLKAEFDNTQGVVAGQGQTLRVAGVRVGDVSKVELVDGRAIVTFDVDREYLPIYKDSTILMRPLTGLRDMFFSLDPGTRQAGEYEEDDTVALANTAPDVPLDELLAALDGDSQAYLRTLLIGAGKGLEGRGKDLGKVLGSLGPINRDLEQLNTEVAKRDENLSRLVHNLSILTDAVGKQDGDIVRLVAASNDTLSAIAQEDPDVQNATRLLPGALRNTRQALEIADEFGNELGGAFGDLRPFARNLPELNRSTTELANEVTPVIRDEIRPLVRAAREPIPDLNTAARRLTQTMPKLNVVGKKLNRLGNMAAYNPRGQEAVGTAGRDEGYLYWTAWTGHNGTSAFSAQDGNGLYRRIFFTTNRCNLAQLVTDGFTATPVEQVVRRLITGIDTALAPSNSCT